MCVCQFLKLARPELDHSRYMEDLATQTITSKLAYDFNNALRERMGTDPPLLLKFLIPKVVRLHNKDGSCRYMAWEKNFRGAPMIKLTNNWSFLRASDDPAIQSWTDLGVAFSHFTFKHTGDYLLVCDLQGVPATDDKGRKTLLLTDPAIHCKVPVRFGTTNMGKHGFEEFFAKHKCNRYCTMLKLPEK